MGEPRGNIYTCPTCGALLVSVCDDEDLGGCVTCRYEQANQDEKEAYIARLEKENRELKTITAEMAEIGRENETLIAQAAKAEARRCGLARLVKDIFWLVNDNGCDEDAPQTLRAIARNIKSRTADDGTQKTTS